MMPIYTCLSKNHYIYEPYELIPLRRDDMPNIKNWRNTQLDVLRQLRPLTDADQKHYFESVILPLFQMKYPGQILFSFLKNGTCIGYGGLVYVSWAHQRAELSFLLDTARISDDICYQADFLAFLNMISTVVFKDLNFNRIFTETFSFRRFHISVLESFGFVKEGVMREHIVINNSVMDSVIHGYIKDDFNAR